MESPTNKPSNKDLLNEVQSRLDDAADGSLEFQKSGDKEDYVLNRSKNVDTWDGDNSASKV